VGWWFLDIPHHIIRWYKRRAHTKKMEDSVRKTSFIDNYAFDLGYHSSYVMTTYAIALVFCVLVPYVIFVATPFFMFKYYVDKYNMTFVYNSEFCGVGTIKK
jgi:ABC-type Fe3+ transport system permease subunit